MLWTNNKNPLILWHRVLRHTYKITFNLGSIATEITEKQRPKPEVVEQQQQLRYDKKHGGFLSSFVIFYLSSRWPVLTIYSFDQMRMH